MLNRFKIFRQDLIFLLSNGKNFWSVKYERSRQDPVSAQFISNPKSIFENPNKNICVFAINSDIVFDTETMPPLSWYEMKSFIKGQTCKLSGKCYFGGFKVRYLFNKQAFCIQTVALNEASALSGVVKHSNESGVLGIFPLLVFMPFVLGGSFGCDVSSWWIFIGQFVEGKTRIVGGYQNNCFINIEVLENRKVVDPAARLVKKLNEVVLYMRRYKWSIDKSLNISSNLKEDILSRIRQNMPSSVTVTSIADENFDGPYNQTKITKITKQLLVCAASKEVQKSSLLLNKNRHRLWLVAAKRRLSLAICTFSCMFFICLATVIVWRPWSIKHDLFQEINNQKALLTQSIRSLYRELDISDFSITTGKLVAALKLMDVKVGADHIWDHLKNIEVVLEQSAQIAGLIYRQNNDIRLLVNALPGQINETVRDLTAIFKSVTLQNSGKTKTKTLISGIPRQSKESFVIDIKI
ncbi:MAG: hypothetical protein LBI30_02005 [Holosporales bacterium]|jgi:hypothetical protein|nr:hypothetical protein [Holosporales bacterium]